MEDILALNEKKVFYIRLACRYLRDYSVAEEMFQKCVFKLLDRREELFVVDIVPFFTTVIKNSCLNHLKARQRELASTESIDGCPAWIRADIERLSSQCDADGLRTDFPKMLEKCRKSLSPLAFDIFLAKRLENKSYKELSEQFNISENKIHSEIKKARKVFREVFKDYQVLALAIMLTSLSTSKELTSHSGHHIHALSDQALCPLRHSDNVAASAPGLS